MAIPAINSFTNWGRLEEVWLGDAYPCSFYDHLESEVRDCFYEITEKTQQDLAIIQQKIQELGVTVIRPSYTCVDDYVDSHGILRRPEICPRDTHLIYGNTMLHWTNPGHKSYPWRKALDRYEQDPGVRSLHYHHDMLRTIGSLSSAGAVRIGKDIYLDVLGDNDDCDMDQKIQFVNDHVRPLWPESRMHFLENGGHIDACFAAIRPGLLLTSSYYNDYDRTFPNWEKINITKPEFADEKMLIKKKAGPGNNGKWWMVPDMKHSNAFNQYVVDHAMTWVGDYTETYFEVNSLVIDENNILMLGENESVARELEKYGMTVHWLPFRTRTFWDGGLHCLTLDIRRQDSPVDLFPERTESAYFYLN